MKLFIANATRQIMEFCYRLPERPGALRQVIPIGGQVQVSGDLTRAEIDYVVEKASIFGLVEIGDAERTGGFSGLCYSVDKPISEDRLFRAMTKRVAVLEDLGREQRKNAAIGVHDQVERQLKDHRDLGTLNGLDMQVVEQDANGGRQRVDGFEDRVNVVRQREGDPARPRNRGRRRAA